MVKLVFQTSRARCGSFPYQAKDKDMSSMTKGFLLVACIALIAVPTLAGTSFDETPKTEKLWRIETSGIGG